jgi:ubiquinol-cytochrome c reductase cytochrome c subunit
MKRTMNAKPAKLAKTILRLSCLAVFAAFAFNGPVVAQDANRGKEIFMRVGCYQCHGREAQGASTGPRLGPSPLQIAAFSRAIRTPRNEMPPYSVKLLSDAELADVYAFVSARPRPHELPK